MSTTILSLSQLEPNELFQPNGNVLKNSSVAPNLERLPVGARSPKNAFNWPSELENLKPEQHSHRILHGQSILVEPLGLKSRTESGPYKNLNLNSLPEDDDLKSQSNLQCQFRSTRQRLPVTTLVAWFDRTSVVLGKASSVEEDATVGPTQAGSFDDPNAINKGWRYGRNGWVKLQNEIGVQPMGLNLVQRLSPLFWALILWVFATLLLVWAS